MANQASAFLQGLFGQKNPDDYVLIWTLQNKKSYWYRSLNQAAIQAQVFGTKQDVYVGVGLSPKAWGDSLRCPSEDVVGLAGLWADIDIADPVHKKLNLPPDLGAAVDLMNAMPFQPSIVVHSGHGLQAWWLFDQIWDLRPKGERENAQRLSRQWAGKLRNLASERGYEVDSVHDLARILRVPGTRNHKNPESIVDVRIVTETKTRYEVSRLRDAVSDVTVSQSVNQATYTAITDGDLVLDPDAEVDQEQLQWLLDAEPRVRAAMKRQSRPQKKGDPPQDTSPSAHDMTIMNLAAMAGWSDQEIVNLIIHTRRQNGEELKLRKSYIGPSLANAHDAADRYHGRGIYDVVSGSLNGHTGGAGSAAGQDRGDDERSGRGSDESDAGEVGGETEQSSTGTGNDDHGGRSAPVSADSARTKKSGQGTKSGAKSKEQSEGTEKSSSLIYEKGPQRFWEKAEIERTLKMASGYLGLEILSAAKYLGDNPSYRVVTSRGQATFTNVEKLRSQTTFRNAIFAATNFLPPPMKAEKWDSFSKMLVNCADQTDIGEDVTMDGKFRSWIAQYTRAHTPLDDEDPNSDRPFYKDDYLCIYGDTFRRWVKMQIGDVISVQELGTQLRIIGSQPGSVEITLKNGRKTFRPTWMIPMKKLEPEKSEKP